MNKYKTTYPGLEGMIITKEELIESTYQIHLERQRTPSRCPRCTHMTSKVHDYRIQKIQHTKLFKRPTVLFYRKRRYACSCGKRFAEHVEFVDRYQRYSKELMESTGTNSNDSKRYVYSSSKTTRLLDSYGDAPF